LKDTRYHLEQNLHQLVEITQLGRLTSVKGQPRLVGLPALTDRLASYQAANGPFTILLSCFCLDV